MDSKNPINKQYLYPSKTIICNHCGLEKQAWYDEKIQEIRCAKCKLTGKYEDKERS